MTRERKEILTNFVISIYENWRRQKSMSHEQSTGTQAAEAAPRSIDQGSDLFVHRLDPKYRSRSIAYIYKAVGSAVIVCFLLMIIARTNRAALSPLDSLAYPIRGWSYTILRGIGAVTIFGVFGYFLSLLNFRTLAGRTLRISILFLFSLAAFFLVEPFLVKPLYYNVIYFAVLMSLPLFACVIFAFRGVPVAGVILSAAGVVVFSEFCIKNLRFAGQLAYLILFLLCAIPLFIIAIARKCFRGSRILNVTVFLLVLILGLTLSAMYHHDNFDDFRKDAAQRVSDFLEPEADAQYRFSNSHDAAVIRRLNSNAALFGSSQISKEDVNSLVDWAWNVPELEKDAPNSDYSKNTLRRINEFKADPDTLSVKSILPRKYDESYLLSLSAWKIGVIPTALLSLVLLAAPVFLLVSSLRRKHPFALLLSTACSLMLLSQTLLYILGNLGYSFALVPALPFLPMNIPALGANLILVGLIAACHRDSEGEAGEKTE
jgi:hypothetical protein